MGTLKIRGIGPIAIMSRIIYNIRDMKGGGIVDNGYTKRIRERVLSLEDGTVFVMSDFADIADTSTIRQSLSRLVQSGILRRILKGVYEKPKYSKLLDEYVAADPEAVANALAYARKMGEANGWYVYKNWTFENQTPNKDQNGNLATLTYKDCDNIIVHVNYIGNF